MLQWRKEKTSNLSVSEDTTHHVSYLFVRKFKQCDNYEPHFACSFTEKKNEPQHILPAQFQSEGW